MCNFVVEEEVKWGNNEYTTYVEIAGESRIFTFEGVLEKCTVEITVPFEEELNQLLTPDCIEQLKKILWNRIRLYEVTGTNQCK